MGLESMVALHRDRLHQLTIGDASFPAVSGLVGEADHAPALQKFVRHSRRAFGTGTGTGTGGTKPSAGTQPTRPVIR